MATDNKIDISTILILNPSGRIVSPSSDRKKSANRILEIHPPWLFNHLPISQHFSHINCASGSENSTFNYHLYFLESIKYLNFKLNIINISSNNLALTKERSQNKEIVLNQLNLKFVKKLNELFAKRISLASKSTKLGYGECAYFLNEVEELLSGKRTLDALEETIKLEASYLDQEETARNLNEEDAEKSELEKEKNKFLKSKNP